MLELRRYVEQGNPRKLQQVIVVLARDAATMAAVCASVAVFVMRHLTERKALGGQSAGHDADVGPRA